MATPASRHSDASTLANNEARLNASKAGDNTPSDVSTRLQDQHASTQDVEKQELGERHTGPSKDPNLVEWDGPDDPGNPLNW